MKRISGLRKVVFAGVAGALALVSLGDRALTQTPPGGQDPLEVLNLQVRANAIIVLDSSGSMREMPDANLADGSPDTPVEGEVAGDDPTSKLLQAKDVLRQVILANETKVSFQFGRYVQDPASYGPEAANRFLYTKTCANTDAACNTAANNLLVNNNTGANCQSAACLTGVFREVADKRTVGGNTTYHLFTNKFFNGERINVRQNGAFTTPVAAAGVVADAGDFGPTTLPPNGPGPWVEVQNLSATGTPGTLIGSVVRFQFKGIRWAKGNNTATSCGGFDNLVGLAPCTQNVQINAIGPHLQPELELSPTGNIVGYTNQAIGAAPTAAQRPPLRGIRASGLTPIAESLIDLRTTVFPPIWASILAQPAGTPKPRTFAIIVTDGDDSCPNSTTADTSTGANADMRALRSAYNAQLLYQRLNATFPESSVTTFVVSFGSGASSTRADWIAWAGSGMNQNGVFCGAAPLPACIPVTSAGTSPYNLPRWSRIPTPAERAACTTCRDAFVAADADELIAALQAAIDQGQSQGEFSDQQSITESVFEFANDTRIPPPAPPSPPASPAPSPLPGNPNTRYSARIPVLLQSTFTMPEFAGKLKAFVNDGSAVPLLLWDAADKLRTRINPPATPWTGRTFAEICGDLSARAPGAATVCASDVTVGSAANPWVIKRRIYSTVRNGVFLSGSDTSIVDNLTTPDFKPADQVAIWPPNASASRGMIVDPAYTAAPAGTALDVALGLTAPTRTIAQLRTEFGACTSPAALPATHPCVLNPTAATIKEARQIVLAFAAGANLIKSGTNAARTGITGACPTPGGCLTFTPRAAVMAESTLAASAVVTPPLQTVPAVHNSEYKLYRDGPRNTSDVATDGFEMGFGLRNPDLDANAASLPDNSPDTRTLKPVMSVVYHGTNHMVHAFRAGACSVTGACLSPGGNETGGEELWAFVPFDQLSKLSERLKPQVRNPHTYVIATPIRVTDVFVPGSFSKSAGGVTVSGTGVWRTVILFGRGIGGKYFTALDVTSPAKFNEGSLTSAPPIAMWSRGNPDTQSGSATGTDYNNTTSAGAADFTAYSGMGQTWSVPALSFVTAAGHITTRRPLGTEFVAFTGSGYGTASEGTTIYTLDMLNGDVVRSANVGDRSGMAYENSLPASAAAFNPRQLISGHLDHPSATPATRVYIPDVHGRIWRLLVANTDPPVNTAPLSFADAGADQPFGNPVALVNYTGTGASAKPHVFANSGNDNRIFPPPANTPPFKMYGLRDDDLGSDPDGSDDVDGPAFRLFSIPFPNGFRGTTQPATAFFDPDPNVQNDESARVFFAGTRFNPVGSPNAPPPPPCRSSFDSVLFAVGAESGGAAYDLNGTGDDRSIMLTQQRIQAVRVHGGRLVADLGLGANNPPPPPAPPTINPPAPAPESNVFMGPPLNPDGTSRIPGLVAFKVNSSVCR